jgi:hypothetical protein
MDGTEGKGLSLSCRIGVQKGQASVIALRSEMLCSEGSGVGYWKVACDAAEWRNVGHWKTRVNDKLASSSAGK